MKPSSLIRAIAFLTICGAFLALTGCETTKGVGRDITIMGEVGQKAISQAFDGDASAN